MMFSSRLAWVGGATWFSLLGVLVISFSPGGPSSVALPAEFFAGAILLALWAGIFRHEAELESVTARYLLNERHASTDFRFLLREVVLERKRPLVWVETELSSVVAEAANLIRSSPRHMDVLGYKLVFVGAVGLQVPPTGRDFRMDVSDDEDRISPHQVYHGALEEIASREVPVARFISLLTEREFEARSPAIRNRFLLWLEAQRGQMLRNSKFQLIDSPRAPKWGATGGSIVSSRRWLQLTHGRGAALIVDDDRMVESLLASIATDIYAGNKENIHVYQKERSERSEALNVYDAGDIERLDLLIASYTKSLVARANR